MILNHNAIIRFIPHFVIIAVSVYLFFLSQNVPLFADDLCRYNEVFSLSNVLANVKQTYLYTAGRVPAMFLNFLFFSSGALGLVILNLINAAVLLGLGVLSLRLIPNANKSSTLIFLAFFYFLFWFAPDTLGEDILWKTGTIQYFWSSVLAIACIFPVFRYAIYQDQIVSKLLTPIYLIGALLAGMWLEHLSVAVFSMWALVLLYLKFVARIKIPGVFWFGLLLWGIGMAILIAAPGNYARAGRIGDAMPLWEKFRQLLPYVLGNIDRKFLFASLLFFIVSSLFDIENLKQRVSLSVLLMTTGLLAALATLGAPTVVYFGRVSFPSELFYVFGVMALFPSGFNASAKQHKLKMTMLILPAIGLSLLLFTDFKNTYLSYAWIAEQEQNRHKLMSEARARGQTRIQLPTLTFSGGHHTKGHVLNWGRMFARDITVDSSRWPNPCYARVHGMEKVAL